MRLFLFGLKHSGKSSVGREVARRLDWPFYDLDELITLEDPDRRSPRLIFRESGQHVFQEYERRAVLRIVDREPPLVLALGGGTVENESAMKHLNLCPNRVWVWLDEDWEILFERVMQGGLPSFLDPVNPRQSFRELAVRRRQLAERYRPHILQVRERGVDDCVQQIIQWKEAGFAG